MSAMNGRRFSIYDMLENRGAFRSNPANPGSIDEQNNQLYSGPVEYPKMLYEPNGEQVVVEAGALEPTPLGVKLLGEQKRMISRIVKNEAEETHWRSLGWHDHPADAMEAAGLVRPPVSPQHALDGKDKEIERLKKLLAEKDGGEGDNQLALGLGIPSGTKNRKAADLAPGSST